MSALNLVRLRKVMFLQASVWCAVAVTACGGTTVSPASDLDAGIDPDHGIDVGDAAGDLPFADSADGAASDGFCAPDEECVDVIADADEFDSTPREIFTPDLPPDFPPRPTGLPFKVERDNDGTGPDQADIAEFTDAYTAFMKRNDYFRWLWRYSQGLPEDNEWGLPGYRVWWTNTYVSRHESVVTMTWHGAPDNTTAKVGRILGATAGLFLDSGDETARDLTFGYIKGLSANYDGMVWGDEDPVIDTIMARVIFNRDFSTELDQGRQLAVDYSSVRYEEFAQRHDSLHNPANPTWGDIYVRNKRSKDDLPYLYRDVAMLNRLAWETRDDDIRAATVKLVRQIRAMAGDIVDHEYCIRTKGPDGKPYIPTLSDGTADDFVAFTVYDGSFPNAECTAKLATAILASGGPLENDCQGADSQFYGHGGLYEDFAVITHFWSANMIWGFHLAALSQALTFGNTDVARKLMDGLIIRIDGLMKDERAPQYLEWWPELSQYLILCAAYGMPLKPDEARLIQTHYRNALDYYDTTVMWDPWAENVPQDKTYPTFPDRTITDDQGNPTKIHVRIEEILNPYEYCSSPFRARNGAQFVDCDRLLDPSSWDRN